MRSRLLLGFVALAGMAQAQLTILPEHPMLYGEGAGQHVVVMWTGGDGAVRDVSAAAHLTFQGSRVAAIEAGPILRAKKQGSAVLEASYEGQTARTTVEVHDSAKPRELSFVNDIVPIFTKFGCAGSNCHGSIRGKAGFKLSLFGYEPKLDYEAIVKAANGRRVNLAKPEESLILKKPTFQVPHGGGLRFEKGSINYNAILEWIRSGARYGDAASPRLVSLAVLPAERRIVGLGEKQQLVVTGKYTDGSTDDLTDKVQFTSNDDAVAEVGRSGLVKPVRPGETTVMVRTLGQAVAARIYVVTSVAGPDYPAMQTNNYIDRFIFEKLRVLNVAPSALSSDEHFLRRTYLDVLGVLPTSEEAKAFLDSQDPGKRTQLIDRLLERPERADRWATYFGDLFRLGFNESRDKGAKIFYDWIRDRIQRDVPYNRMVSELLVSQGNLFYEPTANFYFVSRKLDPGDVATHVTQAFLGVRLECAKCHNHPFEKWTQDDFYGFAAFFARLDTKFVHAGSESNVYLRDEGEVIQPKTKQRALPKYLDGPTTEEQPGADIRQDLAKWVTSPRNPFFARTMVNRIWSRYFGRGIVDPVDDFRVTNPPSHEKLLDALAEDFVSHGYSIRHMERAILNSRTYQLSALPNESNRYDRVNYSRYYLRRMSAEELMDALVEATGVPERFAGWAPGTRAMEIPHGSPSYLLTVFGRVADREFAQDRKEEPSITQALNLINGGSINGKISASGGNLAKWLADARLNDREIAERLFLATLSRRPREAEMERMLRDLEGRPGERREVFQDVFWALINSKEFLYVH